ncbi:MAG: hypothetical protein IIY77_01640, partial [Lachnospiraceae bacterium]|nr:hypothetical protein [Lachnospiraceae bacterium]
MKRNMKWIIGYLLCLILVVRPVCASAEENKKTIVRNRVSIGDIHIRLDVEGSGYEKASEDGGLPRQVVPGERIEKTVKVTNLAREAWVRIRAEAAFETGTMILDNSLLSEEPGWIRKGGYYYWPHPVPEGKSVTFLKIIRIPPSWGSECENKPFSIHFTSQAVQTDHFTPHFNEEDPWFGTVIEECVHTSYTGKEAASSGFSVVFKGGAEGLVKTGNDFFSHWTDLMPGDVASGIAEIKNNYKYPVKLYFSQEAEGLDELAEKLKLIIKNKDKVIFKGLLSESASEVFLGEFKSGMGTELSYTVQV